MTNETYIVVTEENDETGVLQFEGIADSLEKAHEMAITIGKYYALSMEQINSTNQLHTTVGTYDVVEAFQNGGEYTSWLIYILKRVTE